MSGPHCESCDHYWPYPIGKGGQCTDPDKIIYAAGGHRVNDHPEVMPRYECSNHTALAREGGDSEKA